MKVHEFIIVILKLVRVIKSKIGTNQTKIGIICQFSVISAENVVTNKDSVRKASVKSVEVR